MHLGLPVSAWVGCCIFGSLNARQPAYDVMFLPLWAASYVSHCGLRYALYACPRASKLHVSADGGWKGGSGLSCQSSLSHQDLGPLSGFKFAKFELTHIPPSS